MPSGAPYPPPDPGSAWSRCRRAAGGGLGTSLLTALAEGVPPAELVRRAAHAAEDADRQIAVRDPAGRVAADTGQGSFPVSGHLVGDGVSVQDNMLAGDEVLPAMAETFAAARVAPPDRLLAALSAGQHAGGDLRGRQSAALLVVSGHTPTEEEDGVRTDLRVDDSADPVAQLRMLRPPAGLRRA
ncbi:DUF1028 domain-containing protein [Blastococcus mobilis]|uniref:DUF1028 domain-containing protein n=1 Tax=Blastococcus mobilis TaxID=1938746 RepID=UPI0034A0BA54